MSPTLTQAAVVAVLALALWPVLRKLTARRPFHNVRGPPSKSWWKGNILDLLDKRAWEYHHELVEKYGNVFKFSGFFGEPCLYVLDPKALHHILIKDADSYDELQAFFATNQLVFGNGLLSTEGDLHRKQRKMLTPVFSIAHMRRMVPTFYEVVDKLRDTLEAKTKKGPVEIDLLTWMTRTALELIGQSGLGYSFDPLTETGEQHPYSISVKLLISALDTIPFTRIAIVPLVHNFGTARFRRYVIDFLSLFWGNVRRVRDIVDVMDETTHAIYEAKKKALEEGGDALQHHAGKGNDLISILMKANMQASEADRLPEDQVMGQITTFTFAAMDTTSSALARIFQVLSQNQDFQERLRQEIRTAKAKKGGRLEYDDLMALPLLDATCRETLRVYAPIAQLMREARKDVILPLSRPIVGADGNHVNEILVPKGTKIIIAIYSANRNASLWGPDAHEWNPERWLSPLPDNLVKAKVPGVYSHLMTFLGGSRSCIGFKFSELEMKVVITEVLDTLRLSSTNQKVRWNMTAVAHPIIPDGSGTERPQLPIIAELLQN